MRSPFSAFVVVALVQVLAIPLPSWAAPPSGGSSASASAAASTSAANSGGSSGSATPVAATSASGTSGPQNTTVLLQMAKPTLYVLVYAGDPSTTNYVSYELSLLLNQAINHNPSIPITVSQKKDQAWVLPEPAWTLTDFATQCQNDSNTLGALIVYDIETDSGTFNYFILQQGYTHLYAKSLLVQCKRFDAVSGGNWAPGYAPGAGIVSRQDTYSVITPKGPYVEQSESKPAPDATKPQKPTTTTTVLTARTSEVIKTPRAIEKAKVTSTFSNTTTTTTNGTSSTTGAQTPTITRAPTVSDGTTETLTAIPHLTVLWENDDELDYASHQSNIQFTGLAALGTYLASRNSNTVMTSTTTIEPLTPGTSTMAGSKSTTSSTQSNNSNLPLGLAVIAGSVSQFNSISIGGTNSTRILKSAASGLATMIAQKLYTSYYANLTCSDDPAMPSRECPLPIFNKEILRHALNLPEPR